MLPALWVALEWLRTYLGGGFPWNLAGYAWVEVPGALPLVGLDRRLRHLVPGRARQRGGGRLVQRRRWEPAAVGLLVPLLLLPLAGRWSLRQDGLAPGARCRGFGHPVRLLQPNIPNLVDYDEAAVMRNYRRMISTSRSRPASRARW